MLKLYSDVGNTEARMPATINLERFLSKQPLKDQRTKIRDAEPKPTLQADNETLVSTSHLMPSKKGKFGMIFFPILLSHDDLRVANIIKNAFWDR